MKSLVLVLLLLITGSITTMDAAQSQRALNKGTPDVALKNFYEWYVHVLNKNGDPLTNQRARLREFASARLLREIDKVAKGPDGLDGDYFLDAQDWDKQWEKNIAISQVKIRGSKADATVSLTGPEMSRKLKVKLVREGGKWKIDKVQSLN